jgi:hypothetical protein
MRNHLRTLLAAGALAIGGLALPGNASAQAINVFKFECGSTLGSVNVDVRGLGSTDVCVTGTATLDLNCACVNNGGSCPQATNKASFSTDLNSNATLQPKNGRVNATNLSVLSLSASDTLCTAPAQCGSGQTVKLISFATEDEEPTFTLTQGACGSGGATLAGPINCGPTSQVVFGGKKNSCEALFP